MAACAENCRLVWPDAYHRCGSEAGGAGGLSWLHSRVLTAHPRGADAFLDQPKLFLDHLKRICDPYFGRPLPALRVRISNCTMVYIGLNFNVLTLR